MQTVLVSMKSTIDKNGNAKLTPAKEKVYGVKARYMTGEVLTTSGDVWAVEPYHGSKADFKAVAPVSV